MGVSQKFRMMWVFGLALGLSLSALPGLPQEEPKPGGTLVWGLNAEPPNLDPHGSVLINAKFILDYIVETLIVFDNELRVQPHLAESWWVSEDGLIWEFKIREGVRFHNGNPADAHAWAYSLKRFKEKSPMSQQLAVIKEVTAPEDYILRLQLTRPEPRLLELLMQPWTCVLDPEYVEEMGDRFGIEGVNGTGPFELDEWVRGERIVLRRVEDYRHGPAWRSNQGPAYVDKVEFRIVPETSTLIFELTKGEIDITLDIPPGKLDVVAKYENVSVVEKLLDRTYTLVMNCSNAPLTDSRVRRAIAAAIDRQPIVAVAFRGHGEPAYIMCPKAAAGYPAPGIEQEVIAHYQGTDVELAKSLLEEAGWFDLDKDGVREKDGQKLKLSLWSTTQETFVLTAQIVQAQLAEVGIATELITIEPGTYYGMVAAKPEYDLCLRASGYPLAIDNIYYQYYSKNIGASNYTRYDYGLAPQIDEWLDKARALPTAEERYAAFAEALKLIGEANICVPLAYPTYAWAWKTDRLGGVEEALKHPWYPSDVPLEGLEFYIKGG